MVAALVPTAASMVEVDMRVVALAAVQVAAVKMGEIEEVGWEMAQEEDQEAKEGEV